MNHEPKFKVGDTVRCQRQSETFGDFDFTGKVTRYNLVDDEYEYWIDSAPRQIPGVLPLLVWESEMTLVEAAPC